MRKILKLSDRSSNEYRWVTVSDRENITRIIQAMRVEMSNLISVQELKDSKTAYTTFDIRQNIR